MRVSVSIILDKRRELNNGKFPVKLRITHNRITRYIATSYSFSESEFEKIISGKRLSPKESKINIQFGKLRERADLIISEMGTYTFDSFKSTFLNKKKSDDIFDLIEEYINLLPERSVTIKEHAKALINHLKYYTGKDEMDASGVTVKFVDSFISHLLTNGMVRYNKSRPLSKNTVKRYVDVLKSVILKLIKDKRFSSDNYPFTPEQSARLRSAPIRTVLTLEEMGMYINYVPTKKEAFALDMFIFSYLASGMNMNDIFRLKWSNVNNDRFTFTRTKTQRSPTLVTVFIDETLTNIIKKHGSSRTKDSYIFDVLKEGMNFMEEKKAIGYAIELINDRLKEITEKLQINKHVTTYTARHSYATIMMSNEVPLAFISKQLGHANLSSTQVYLSGFPDHKAKEYSAHLIPKSEKENG